MKLQIAVLRACGLKTAAKIAASLVQDKDLEYRSAVGLDTYAVMKLSFLHDEVSYLFDCSVLWSGRNVVPRRRAPCAVLLVGCKSLQN